MFRGQCTFFIHLESWNDVTVAQHKELGLNSSHICPPTSRLICAPRSDAQPALIWSRHNFSSERSAKDRCSKSGGYRAGSSKIFLLNCGKPICRGGWGRGRTVLIFSRPAVMVKDGFVSLCRWETFCVCVARNPCILAPPSFSQMPYARLFLLALGETGAGWKCQPAVPSGLFLWLTSSILAHVCEREANRQACVEEKTCRCFGVVFFFLFFFPSKCTWALKIIFSYTRFALIL